MRGRGPVEPKQRQSATYTIHLVALGINIIIYAPGRTWQSLAGGGLAYFMLYAMVLTSTDGWQRRLGGWWRRIHLFGIYYLWFIFTVSYAARAFGADPDKRVVGLLFGSVMIAALVYVMANLLADIASVLLNPRLRTA